MVGGKTASGFEFEINPDKLKDARFLMEYAKIKAKGYEMGNLILIEQILGPEGFAELCKHCENKDGIALIDTVASEFKEIVGILSKDSETKN